MKMTRSERQRITEGERTDCRGIGTKERERCISVNGGGKRMDKKKTEMSRGEWLAKKKSKYK